MAGATSGLSWANSEGVEPTTSIPSSSWDQCDRFFLAVALAYIGSKYTTRREGARWFEDAPVLVKRPAVGDLI